MNPEELLFEIDQLRIKHRGKRFAIDKPIPYIEDSCELIKQFKKEVELETLKNVQMGFMVQSDLSTKTHGYRRLCEQIKQLTKQNKS